MNIQEALDMVDRMKPNMMDEQIKIRFLSELDGKIHEEIVLKHVFKPSEAKRPKYDTDTDPGTELIIPAPYDMLYVYYLMMQIDLMNQEMDKYNNDAALFDKYYGDAADWWNRRRMPISRVRELRI